MDDDADALRDAPAPAAGLPTRAPGGDVRGTRHAQVLAVLTDPRFGVPDLSTADQDGGIAWLRASVARFSNGHQHARRRATVTRALRGLRAEELCADAIRLTEGELHDAAPTGHVDVMARIARRVPLGVLAARLGVPDVGRAVEAVTVAAAAYQPGSGPEAERAADTAVAELVAPLGSASSEEVANRIGLLIPACDATAGLIGKAVRVLLHPPDPDIAHAPTEPLLAEVLRHDPLVRATRRVARVATQRFDPTRDNQAVLTFGAGLRPCPGSALALALAAGVVDVIRRRRRSVLGPVECEPSPNLRVPAGLRVVLR